MLLALALFIASPAQAETSLPERIDHFIRANKRAQRSLEAFDRQLDAALKSGTPGLLQSSAVYHELIALRQIQHNDADAIADALQDPAQQSLARSKLASLSASELPAANALLANIASHESELAPVVATLHPVAPANRVEVIDAEATDGPTLLDLEISEVQSDLGIPFTASARSKRKDRYRPGTGPEGNLSGREFPLNTWALTFDDGPHRTYTRQIVDMLRARGKKTTFFWLAKNVNALRDVVGYARSAGMTLANHSYSHANLSKAGEASLDREIIDSTELEARIYGSAPEFFRTPYGAGRSDSGVRRRIAREKMIHVFWNVDSLDWQDKDARSVFARVKKQMQLEKRGVVLFHDIHPQSVEAATMLMDYSDSLDRSRNKLRWVSMPEIRDELNRAP